MPVWGVWLGGAVWFSTSPRSQRARNLARIPSVVVHVESGDEVVILEGTVERAPLTDAYGAKYEWRPDPDSADHPWYRLRPEVAYAWREADYPRTATRFAFSPG